MTPRLLLLAALCFVSTCYAQAYKCKMPDGKVMISNEGCANGGRLEQITTASPVTYDRWRQAAEVNARANMQLDGIARENAIYQQKLRQQQATQAVIDQQHAAQQARNDALDRHKKCIDEANRYRDKVQARMIAACNGVPYYDDEVSSPVQVASTPSPLPVIKNCFGNTCRDQMGNRYRETAGKITNSQGQRCYQRGKVMYCN